MVEISFSNPLKYVSALRYQPTGRVNSYIVLDCNLRTACGSSRSENVETNSRS